jgi:hypothetical protein
MYSGCVLNAIRDRNNDYFKALNALVPKNKLVVNNKNDNAATPAEQPVQQK